MKHYLCLPDTIREVSHAESIEVANGSMCLPQYAGECLRYIQVELLDDDDAEEQVEVRIAGALLDFDDDGRLTAAHALEEGDDHISEFERETCAELAILDEMRDGPTVQ